MIQFNLLPQVKLDFLKAQRQRRLMSVVSFFAVAASVVLLLGLLSVDSLQKKHLSDLNRDITRETNQLTSEPQIDKVLTVQNQLASLTGLHQAKPAASQLFSYLNQVTPSNVTISSFAIDFTQDTINITGGASSLSDVNQYVDTLKFTKYTTTSNATATAAFNNVVLGSFSLTSATDTAPAGATYNITASYDPPLFDITQKAVLAVPPQLVTTRSELDKPTDLFKAQPVTDKAK